MKALEKLKVFGTCSVIGASVALASPPSYALDLFGPLSYLGFSDSPFEGQSFGYFHLEDFEDGALNVPGVTPSTGGVTSGGFSGPIIDSVEDWPSGDSFFGSGTTGFTFSFSKAVLGSLPTHAGLVWVDGRNNILFEAFDELGNSLGTRGGSHAGSGFADGDKSEDRFYGAINTNGISAIKITGGGGGIEIDHLQYGGGLRQQPPSTSSVPGPLPVFGAAAAFGFSRSLRRRLKAVAPHNTIK